MAASRAEGEMKSIEELEEELKAAVVLCDRVSQRKLRNVGNCPSDLQEYDETWRNYQRIQHQLTQARKAKQAACQHRWEETFFGQKHWAKGTHQYTCRRCNDMRMIRLETSK